MTPRLTRVRPAHKALAFLAASTLLLAACSNNSSANPEGRATDDGHVTYLQLADFGGGSSPQINYNPYSATALGPMWTLYDPLFVINEYNCDEVPQLATSYTWTSPTEMHLTTREGVTWNDGKPFSAKDVAFSFNVIKDNAALDRNGVAPNMVSADAVSDTEVVLKFNTPSFPMTNKLLTLLIVPEHVWSSVTDLVAYTAPDGIGTGMYKVKTFTPQQFVVERSPSYWQADKVVANEIRFVKDGESQINQLNLSKGMYDAQYMYVPDIENTYVAKNPTDNHYWFPAGSPISLLMNLGKEPFSDLGFRQAITYGMDKDKLVKQAGEGYTTVASQTSLVVPGQADWLDPSITDMGIIKFDAAKASQMLTDAGYALDADGKRLGKDGTPMSFTFITPQGWDDWTRAAKEVQTDFQALGITVAVNTPQYETLEEDRRNGNYEMTFGVRGGSCSMFSNFDEPLNSANTAPIGQPSTTNDARWSDATTDQLLTQLANTADLDEQKPIVQKLENIMMDKVPFIPLWYGGKWFEYSTANAIGWPNADDPYAAPSNNHLIFTSLKPAP